ncbi:MAG: PadR family transcriptional regulator [Candidatus Hodarchaeales archaeon]|jgi:DNA-binding PadR family transcriptional regulator
MDEPLFHWQTEFRRGYAKPCVLYVLSTNVYHAYRIKREVQKLTDGHIVIAGSNIYALLRGLVNEGLVERFEKENQKVYKITPEGRKFLEKLHESLRDFLDTMQRFIAKRE